MIIGNRYNLSLKASVAGVLTIRGGLLIAITDSSSPNVAPVISDYHSRIHSLPENLKYLDIYGSIFYHFREGQTGRLSIVPRDFIIDSSIEESVSYLRRLEFNLDSQEDYKALNNILTDAGFNYREI